jgi:AraC-like DNA-binding protein
MLERPTYLRERPGMTADPFSEILRLTKAESLVTGEFSASGRWAIRFPVPSKIKFFAIVKGTCVVRLDGHKEWSRFDVGDVGLLSAGKAFVIASHPNVKPVDAMPLFSGAGRSTAKIGDGSELSYIGGHVLLDPTSGDLLANVIPPWIHIGASSPHAHAFRWLLEQLVEERANPMPGGQLASAQLAQLLFIQILRAHLASSNIDSASWLRALGDPRVAPALRLMHDNPARDWRLDELAKASAMSRTTFAAHFKTAAGVAPLAYLTEWRMRLAGRALREEDKSVAEVAHSLGYLSESAFSHAFKRVTGTSPRGFRSAKRSASSTSTL